MTNVRQWGARGGGLMGVVLALGAGTVNAQSAPPTLSREQVNPAQQTPQAHRQRPVDLFSAPPLEACPLSDDAALSFEFHQGVLVDDAKVLNDRDRQFAWGALLGKRITPRQLCGIRDALASRIFRRGILARVIIPPQTITSGVVRFQVIAAKIVSVRFDGDDIGPAQAEAEAYLNHMRRRNAFSLDEVQKWLLLVNDIPGVQAVARIAHSDAPGAPPEGLDLVVTVRREAVDESGLIANTNAQTLGPWNALARVDFNSFTRFGERTSLVGYTTLGNFRQEVIQVIESARLGDTGLSAQASFSYGHSQPGNVLAPLALRGDSYVGSAEIDYPLIRLQRRTVIVAAGFDLINQNTIAEGLPSGSPPLADDSLRVLWLRADAAESAVDRRWGGDLVSTAADLSLQGRKGLDVLGASNAGDVGLSRPGGRADAWVLRADGHASVRVAPLDASWPPVTLGAHFVSQVADRKLLSYEQQAIGNLTIGRGYDPGAVSGDDVVGGDLKLEIGPLKIGGMVRVTPYGFFDIEQVSYLGNSSPDVTLRSAGGGLEWRIPYDSRGDAVRMDLGYAKPFDRTVPGPGKLPPDRFLVQIIVNH
jgi:hemolysin activation/secretion protein